MFEIVKAPRSFASRKMTRIKEAHPRRNMRITFLITCISYLILMNAGCASDDNGDAQPDNTEHRDLMPTSGGSSPTPAAPASIKNLSKLIEGLNLTSAYNAGFKGQNTTVAILDNGYWGLSASMGVTLPPNLFVEQPASGSMSQTPHGTKLAEIVYALTTGSDHYDKSVVGPEIRLYITSGSYLNFEKAVNDLIQFKTAHPYRNVIALYSQIWQYGDNDNGVGYINTLVSQAAKAGILWVNAAGNLGQATYFATATRRADGYLELPHEGNSIRFSLKQGTKCTIALSWDDFSSTYFNYATAIDLDLTLIDGSGKVMAKGNMVQDGKDHGDTVGYSRFAREMIIATLDPGEYRLQVSTKDITLPAGLTFTLSVDGGPDVIMEKNNGYQKLFTPADDADVISVGAYDVGFCNALFDAKTKRFTKPDVWTASIIDYTSGESIAGSSTAAAIAAAVLAVKSSAAKGLLTRAAVIAQLNSGGALSASADQARTLISGAGAFPMDQGFVFPPVLWLGAKN